MRYEQRIPRLTAILVVIRRPPTIPNLNQVNETFYEYDVLNADTESHVILKAD